MGVGGWVTPPPGFGECDFCDDVAGQYTLDFTAGCVWNFTQEDVCTSFGDDFDLTVELSHLPNDTPATCSNWQWDLVVTLAADVIGKAATATYRSSASTDNDCFDLGGEGTTDRITLTKFSETTEIGACQGNLPNTVEIWATT